MKAPLWKTLDRALRKKMAPAQKKKKKKKGKFKCMAGKERTKLTVCRTFREQCFSFPD